MTGPANPSTQIEQTKDHTLFGALLFIGIVVIVFTSLRAIFSLRPRVLP